MERSQAPSTQGKGHQSGRLWTLWGPPSEDLAELTTPTVSLAHGYFT